jgi:type VII secretion protein EccE
VPHGASLCGVRVDEHEVITMISVAGLPYVPTLLRGPAASKTPNVMPLGTLAGLLDQPGGLRLAGIDVVSAGLRVRRGAGYPPLYSTLLADRPAAGQRSTRLVVRLDIGASVTGLTYRSSIGAAAAAATERIVNALLQEGIRAEALNAHQLDAALTELGAGLVVLPRPPAPDGEGADGARRARPGARAVAARVGWRTVNAHPGHLTTYYFSPDDITTAALNQVWSLRTDAIVQTTTIGKVRGALADGEGPVTVSATVRCNDPQPPQQPPTLYLNPLPGDQYAATVRVAPTARPVLALPTRPLGDPGALAIPIGPTGILVGTAVADDQKLGALADDLVMLSLTDPQRATRIAMDTSPFYARQLLIRAAAVGERIAIYTNEPAKWASLAQPYIAVVDRSHPPEFVPSIIVSDRPGAPPAAGFASTVITIGRGETGGTTADLRFVQMSRSVVRITAPSFVTDVAIAAFRQEQAWTG